jgi:hypothetical protein
MVKEAAMRLQRSRRLTGGPMKSTKQVPLALILVAVLSACSGSDKATPTAPSAPSSPSAPVPPSPPTSGPGSGTIAIRELSPAPGATLVVRSDCLAGHVTGVCAENWRGAFDVLVDREMPNAVLTVRFYDGQTKCGYGAGTLDIVPAGTRVSFSVHGVVVKDEWLAQQCRLPATTNRIEAELWSDSSTWTNTLIQVFEGGYTFSEP